MSYQYLSGSQVIRHNSLVPPESISYSGGNERRNRTSRPTSSCKFIILKVAKLVEKDMEQTYCWWFRNPKQPPGMSVNQGMSTTEFLNHQQYVCSMPSRLYFSVFVRNLGWKTIFCWGHARQRAHLCGTDGTSVQSRASWAARRPKIYLSEIYPMDPQKSWKEIDFPNHCFWVSIYVEI